MKNKKINYSIVIVLLVITTLTPSNPQEQQRNILLDNLVLLPIENSLEQTIQDTPPLVEFSIEGIPQDSCVVLISKDFLGSEDSIVLDISETCTQQQIDALTSLPPSQDIPSQISLILGTQPACEPGKTPIPAFTINVFPNGLMIRPINPVCEDEQFSSYKKIFYIDEPLMINSEFILDIDLQSQKQLENLFILARTAVLSGNEQQLFLQQDQQIISQELSTRIQSIQQSIENNEFIEDTSWENIFPVLGSVSTLPSNTQWLAPALGELGAIVTTLGASTTALGAVILAFPILLSGESQIPQTTNIPPQEIEDIDLLSEQIVNTVRMDPAFRAELDKIIPRGLDRGLVISKVIKDMLKNSLIDEVWQDQREWQENANILLIKWFPIQIELPSFFGLRNIQVNIPQDRSERIRLTPSTLSDPSLPVMSEIDGIFIIIKPYGVINQGSVETGTPSREILQSLLRGIVTIPISKGQIIIGLLGISNQNQHTIALFIPQQYRADLAGRLEDLTGAGMDSIVNGITNKRAFYESLLCVRNPLNVHPSQQYNRARFNLIRNKIRQGKVIARNIWIPILDPPYSKDNAANFQLQECGLNTILPFIKPNSQP